MDFSELIIKELCKYQHLIYKINEIKIVHTEKNEVVLCETKSVTNLLKLKKALLLITERENIGKRLIRQVICKLLGTKELICGVYKMNIKIDAYMNVPTVVDVYEYFSEYWDDLLLEQSAVFEEEFIIKSNLNFSLDLKYKASNKLDALFYAIEHVNVFYLLNTSECFSEEKILKHEHYIKQWLGHPSGNLKIMAKENDKEFYVEISPLIHNLLQNKSSIPSMMIKIDEERQKKEQPKIENKTIESNNHKNKEYSHKGLWYRSKTETKIADALEDEGCLFYPNNACRLKNKTGYYQNKESDFLICNKGYWGILEVDGEMWHTSAAKDHERDDMFNAHGVWFIKRYPADRCWNNPNEVVREFLQRMEQFYSQR